MCKTDEVHILRFKTAISIDHETGNSDIWIADLARGVRTRLTFGALNETDPVWSADGSKIVYRGVQKVFGCLMSKRADGSGNEEVLLESPDTDWVPSDWSRDGRYIVLIRRDRDGKTKGDIWVLPMFGDKKPFPFLATQFDEDSATLSPDGRWMLYTSDESGRSELYVSPFPAGGAKWQVSTAGAIGGGFARGGKEIGYGSLEGNLMTVEITTGTSTFQAGRPVPQFKVPPIAAIGFTDDGTRIFMAPLPPSDQAKPVAIVLDWPAIIKE